MEINYSYKEFFQHLYNSERPFFELNAETEETYREWKKEFREVLRDKLGLNLLADIVRRQNGGRKEIGLIEGEVTKEKGYIRKKYMMETLPSVWMPFYMLVPDGIDKEHPGKAMIAIPAHGANKNTIAGVGETKEEKEKIQKFPKEAYGLSFVKKGYVVFCPDPPGYGERVEPMPSEDKTFLPEKERTSLDCSCKDLAQTAEAFGLSLTALEIWDLIKLLDFMCRAEEVDKEHIGCGGFSGGGQYTMWLAALDNRIRLAVVSGYVHGYYDSILECHLCPCNYAPGLWKLGDISDICALIAPRPLFIENGISDVENGPIGIEGPKRQVEKIRKAYRLFHAEKQLEHVTPQGPHQWYGECYEFVSKYL
ncbi:alpha/beta hydrolase family protein [Kineothrix sp. MB12-C1]|uniref:alpha/beta hydrolase family protein n=1 Tax=Kineothrix sp. MB12-C1 TaxID=3070215 RepID=UPI0027D2661C|nr:alpha/beta hydrolase family protein [Kineothrix sp. MB12-C1]WMC91944.1 alpha/beta hydrolase family protein [Kineothrix sp. MB12-C1]